MCKRFSSHSFADNVTLRYAVSLIWILDKDDYEVKDVWYGKTIIRSRYKLFYEVCGVNT